MPSATIVAFLALAVSLAAAAPPRRASDLAAEAVEAEPELRDGYSPGAAMRYLMERTRFLKEESLHVLGSRLSLAPAEERVNAQLMRWKRHEYNVPEDDFLPAHSFFLVREQIEKSDIFQFIRKMPKGAVLHVHDLSAANVDYAVELSYREDLWGLIKDGTTSLKFASQAPGEGWELVSELRRKAKSVADFDDNLRAAFAITVPNPAEAYPDQATVWSAFNDRFTLLFGFLTYRPVFEDYFRRTLQDFYDDNVMYVEMRGVLPAVYELDGTTLDEVAVATLYRRVADEFQRDHPDFLGARIIYAPSRHVAVSKGKDYMKVFRRLHQAMPNFIAGFDLVAHEDDGRPLIDFVPEFLKLREDVPEAKFFFHAGETNWAQSATDENLVDAVLLNTTRIGHGYAINKHPKVLEVVKARGIGIEINPISNQVLNLVRDLRNHPGATLLTDGYPVVISCDDPGMWGARALSYDFYEAFLGIAGAKADLRTLKQLAINSIQYSAMPDKEKRNAMKQLMQQWASFIQGQDPNGQGRLRLVADVEHDGDVDVPTVTGTR